MYIITMDVKSFDSLPVILTFIRGSWVEIEQIKTVTSRCNINVFFVLCVCMRAINTIMRVEFLENRNSYKLNFDVQFVIDKLNYLYRLVGPTEKVARKNQVNDILV